MPMTPDCAGHCNNGVKNGVMIGMSGGVDSSVASLLLREQGYHVTGLFLITHDDYSLALADATAVSHRLGQELLLLDVRERFRELVVGSFVDAWRTGRTPNPCVLCNPAVKFAKLLDTADRSGCPCVATGHYASVRRHPQSGRLALAYTGAGQKDQTYFLYRLTQEQLARLVFPLAGLNKARVRELAAAAGLTGKEGTELADKPDSQDICFIPDQDYLALLRREFSRRGLKDACRLLEPGPIVDAQGRVIGEHKGLLAYTFGQRKGFDVKTTERLFVLDRIFATNTLVVGPYAQVLRREIHVKEVVYSGVGQFEQAQAVTARVRSSAKPVACRVFSLPDHSLKVCFDQPVAAPTPGQSCVFYDDEMILAGGLIDFYSDD